MKELIQDCSALQKPPECFICKHSTRIHKLSSNLCVSRNWVCETCGLVFSPRDLDIKKNAQYYKEGNYYTNSPNLAARSFFISRQLLMQIGKKKIQEIESLLMRSFSSNERILDVGCGYGENLAYLKDQRGATVLGLEPSSAASYIGGQLFGVDIIPNVLGEWSSKGEKFDFVMCNHTLEHVEDPISFLCQIKELLKPEGVMYLEVPNIMWPSGGFSLDDFLYHEHIQTFSSYNLGILLNHCGFYIQVFSDKNFLKFVCLNNDSTDATKIPKKISYEEIELFLTNYKKNYSILSHLMVYIKKFRYLNILIYSKIVDAIKGW